MITGVAMLIGALTSAAWVAPRPWCFVLSLVAWLMFVWIKGAN